ncbi:MAG: hypothetical protein WHX52_18480 [Anaerolineae bacterium]
MTGIFERDRYGVGQGQYSSIERETWQQITFQAGVLVPVGQAAVIAGSWALVVGIVAGVVCHLAGWPVKYALAVGALALAVLMAWQTGAAIDWTRGAYLARERYMTEKQQGAQADKTVVTVEWVDRQANSGYGRTVYEDLAVSPEQLALVARADRLSKRGLMEAGLNDAQAMRLLAQLLALGYIARQADNLPATWTSKGEALRKAFAGGGGGGVVVDALHHQ